MQTYLIASSNNIFIEGEINKFKKRLNITPYTFHEIIPAPSIGIEQVRQLKQIFSRKPLGGKERLVVVKDIDKATIPAQNALLKLLEEPPADTYIILITGNVQQLLPTVVSRSQLINDINSFEIKHSDPMKTKQLIKKIITSSAGERILISSKLAKTREEAVEILDLLIITFRQLLYQQDTTIKLLPWQLADCLKKVMAAKSYIEKNVNCKATLDILFLGLPKA